MRQKGAFGMTEKEKAAAGLLYDANYNDALRAELLACKDICCEINALRLSDAPRRTELLCGLLGHLGARTEIWPPFWCDYGYHIHIGEDSFLNQNTMILDGASVHIGNHVFIAPNCAFYTAGHPLDICRRNAGLEYAKPIVVQDHVWIGGNVVVLPGVTIGTGAVIGAGSVVTHDVPAGMLAAGNPCRVIRKLTSADAQDCFGNTTCHT